MKRCSLLILVTICAAFALAGCSETQDTPISGPTGLLKYELKGDDGPSCAEQCAGALNTCLDIANQSLNACLAAANGDPILESFCIQQADGNRNACLAAAEACYDVCDPRDGGGGGGGGGGIVIGEDDGDDPYDIDIIR